MIEQSRESRFRVAELHQCRSEDYTPLMKTWFNNLFSQVEQPRAKHPPTGGVQKKRPAHPKNHERNTPT